MFLGGFDCVHQLIEAGDGPVSSIEEEGAAADGPDVHGDELVKAVVLVPCCFAGDRGPAAAAAAAAGAATGKGRCSGTSITRHRETKQVVKCK